MSRFLLLFILLSGVFEASAQGKGKATGRLTDTTESRGLPDATVAVINRTDSTLVSFSLSTKEGRFEVAGIPVGDYIFFASLSGYENYYRNFSLRDSSMVADFGEIVLIHSYKTLDEIVVTDDAPVRLKGDTLAFKADYFKTRPNATVEDLLKKIPGLQVDRDGTVNAQGEKVQKVYVDGKEFFGDDPKLATKNLTADMVDEVQVYDDMSEQAKFNQIDDGSRTKAINLKLKKDRKKGMFGKVSAGYGTDNRYDASANAHMFRGKTQLSFIGKANNTNNIGFTLGEMLTISGGGMGGGMGGFGGGMRVVRTAGMGGSFGGMNIGSGGTGITSSWQAGVNYRDEWGSRFDVNGSYFFNHSGTDIGRKSFRQSFFDSTVTTDQQTISRTENDNHRFHFNMEYEIDSLNSIIFTPSISQQRSFSFNDDTSTTYADSDGFKYLVNDTRAQYQSVGEGWNANNNLIYRRRFRTRGRTLSLNLSNSFNRTDADGLNTSNSNFYDASGNPTGDLNFRQKTVTENNNDSYGLSLSYTEPLGRTSILEFNYSYNYSNYASDRITYDYNDASDKYDQINDSLSNIFENLNESNRVGTNFRVTKEKFNYQLGVSLQRTRLESDNISKGTEVRQRYTNIFPNASFNYKFARNRNLRLSYRGRTSQPSVSQLQPVPDVTNPLYIRMGNPNLDQEFSNTITASYQFFDIVKFRTVFAYLNYSNTYNKITNSIELLPGGKQVSMPVNIDGAMNASGNITFGFPIRNMKGGNFTASSRIMYNRNPGLIDGEKYFNHNLVLGEDFRLSYTHKEKLDLGIGAGLNYNKATYSEQEARNTEFVTHNYTADISYMFPGGFSISTDVDYTFNTGRTEGYNQNFAMWNAAMSKQVFKNKKGEIKLAVFDILKQNVSINRVTGVNYIEDVQSNVLQRFFLLSFTYSLNRMGGKSTPAIPKVIERGMRNIRIMQ